MPFTGHQSYYAQRIHPMHPPRGRELYKFPTHADRKAFIESTYGASAITYAEWRKAIRESRYIIAS
jgi:hypothetical protein